MVHYRATEARLLFVVSVILLPLLGFANALLGCQSGFFRILCMVVGFQHI
jgi:hypothetical protein